MAKKKKVILIESLNSDLKALRFNLVKSFEELSCILTFLPIELKDFAKQSTARNLLMFPYRL